MSYLAPANHFRFLQFLHGINIARWLLPAKPDLYNPSSPKCSGIYYMLMGFCHCDIWMSKGFQSNLYTHHIIFWFTGIQGLRWWKKNKIQRMKNVNNIEFIWYSPTKLQYNRIILPSNQQIHDVIAIEYCVQRISENEGQLLF